MPGKDTCTYIIMVTPLLKKPWLQFNLRRSNYPSCFVLREIPFILISPNFEYFYNDPSVFRGKFSYPFQLGQQVQSSGFPVLLLWAPCSTHLALMCRISEVPKFTSCLEPNQWNHKVIQDNIFGLFKNTTGRQTAILARQEVKEYCQKK